LEPKMLRLVLETVKVMQSLGKTVLLVEQNVRTGLGLATRGVVMESGRVRLEGTHDEILGNPEISHLYLGGTLSEA